MSRLGRNRTRGPGKQSWRPIVDTSATITIIKRELKEVVAIETEHAKSAKTASLSNGRLVIPMLENQLF